MGVNRTVYIGHYLRVWMPKEKHTSVMGTCPNCERKNASMFCPHCGGPLVFGITETLPGIYDYCKMVFDNEDRFFNRGFEDEMDYIIVLENNSNPLGCLQLDDYKTEQELPDKDERHEDWTVLTDALSKDDIKYEQRFGIVNYYR